MATIHLLNWKVVGGLVLGLAVSCMSWLQAALVTGLGLVAWLAHCETRRRGYASLAPQWLVSLLFKRSLFDLLCDLYFLKRISRLAKAILTPLLSGSPPSKAHLPFLELEPGL
jgi:hypothetical protein